MRYILDSDGYIDSVSCTPFNCKDKSCQEYTGTIPSGYDTLEEWALNANIRAYKITKGNLEFDGIKDAALINEWSKSGHINTYSTNETMIGMWFNKPIYRKCYKVNSFPNDGKSYLDAGVDNIKEVIHAGGYAKTSNETIFLQSAYDGTHHDAIVYEPNSNQIRLRASSDRTGYSGYVWIEYTKTTD